MVEFLSLGVKHRCGIVGGMNNRQPEQENELDPMKSKIVLKIEFVEDRENHWDQIFELLEEKEDITDP